MIKRIPLLVLFLAITLLGMAQAPKGSRILAYQVDMAQNNNYDSAYFKALDGCMESIHLFSLWSNVEPDTGNFDQTAIQNFFDIIDIYHPLFGTQAELQLAPVNTVAKEVPSELMNIPFDSPIMIRRFKIYLDTVFAHIPNLELAALNIGNENDLYFDTPGEYTAYKVFMDSIRPYAKQLYWDQHAADLKVGTTFTLSGLLDPATSSLCQQVNTNLDIVATTYYPLNGNFTMKPPSVVATDFANLVAAYPDTSQPIYIVECGYASSPICNSSEAAQADFYRNVFAVWDTYQANIHYLTIFKTTDWSQAEVNLFAQYYGINDPIFLEYLRTLGIRTFPGDGTDKLAFDAIKCELNDRNWCNVNCPLTAVEPESNATFQYFPNPFHDQLHIQGKPMGEISLFDVHGRMVKRWQGNGRTEMTLKGIQSPSGMYWLHIVAMDGTMQMKKLVQSPGHR